MTLTEKQKAGRRREIITETGDLVYLIHVQWWRPLRNRHRRQRVSELLAEMESL